MVASSHPARRQLAAVPAGQVERRSMAAVMAGSALTGNRATVRSAPRAPATRESGLEQLHAGDEPRRLAGQRPDGVEAGREGPDTPQGDPAPGGLQAGRATARGGDAHRATGVAAVGDVRLTRRHRDRRAAGRATGHQGGIERVDRCPVPAVHARHPEGQLVEVGAPDDAGPGRPRPGQACGVATAGLHGRHGAATRRRGLPRHVDQVLDGQADTGTRRVVAGDEGGHQRSCPSAVGRRSRRGDRRDRGPGRQLEQRGGG